MARAVPIVLSIAFHSVLGLSGSKDTSALLQIKHESIQESYLNELKRTRSRLEKIEQIFQQNSSLVVTSSTSVEQMQKEIDLYQKKLSGSHTKNTAEGWMIATSIIDGILIGYEALTPKKFKCDLAVTAVWITFGMLAMCLDQNLTIPSAIDMLVQQWTSVGYGSSTQETGEQKIMHGLHGIVSQLAVGGVLTAFSDVLLASIEYPMVYGIKLTGLSEGDAGKISASIMLVLVTFLDTLAFAYDLGSGTPDWLNGFYQALITMTTIGYGDQSPTTDWKKYTSVVTVPVLVSAFNRWKNAIGLSDDGADKETEKWLSENPVWKGGWKQPLKCSTF